jgi:hypothetical protein
MLMDRIMGAFTFRREVYAEVEHDTSFTGTAWAIVAVVAFLSQLGSNSTAETVSGWIIRAAIGTAFTLLGFAVGAFVIAWLGKAMFTAEVTFDELVRALGLAYVWNVVGVVGLLGFVSPTLVCVVTPAVILASLLGIYSWFIAAREALDLDTVQTIVTVIVGWVVVFIITAAAGFVVGLLGLGVGVAAGAISG